MAYTSSSRNASWIYCNPQIINGISSSLGNLSLLSAYTSRELYHLWMHMDQQTYTSIYLSPLSSTMDLESSRKLTKIYPIY